MLVRQLLEVVQNLLLYDRRQALHLLDEDSFVHLDLTDVSDRVSGWLLAKLLVGVLLGEQLAVATLVLVRLGKLQLFGLQVEQATLLGDVVLENGGA